MLTVSQLSKSFAGRALFDDVSLQVNRGDRIGLVGPNETRKSTLFALLLGDVSPDNGTIAIEKNATHRNTHALPPSIETSRGRSTKADRRLTHFRYFSGIGLSALSCCQ